MELSGAVTIIERQKEIAIEIEKKREGAVKYGSKRTLDAYQRIFNDIQALWTEFALNDANLTEASAADDKILSQSYFTEKRKEIAELIFKKATSFILSHFPEIEGGDPSDIKEKVATSNVQLEDSRDDPKAEINTNDQPSTANDALLKLSEVLATQQQFQLLIQQQMASLMANQERHKGLKPPRVDIPVFDGSQLSLYKGFKDTFLRMTNDSNLSKLEKLTLLKGKITGIAEGFISHITIAESNYDKTWKILDDWFDDPVAIISTSVDKILDMKHIPPNDCRAVESALNLIQGVANSLELLEIDPNQVFLVRVIMRKLSDEACGELTRFIGNHKEFPTYQRLLDFFVHHLYILRARNREQLDQGAVSSNVEEKKEKDRISKSRQVPRQQISKSHATVASDETQYHCFICFEQHLAPACPRLSNSENTYNLLKHYNICTKCAAHKFNRRKPCIRKVSCEICREDHITALHGKANGPNNHVATHLCADGVDTPTSVLLPTAVAKFFGKNFDVEKRALIDVCSQASYIEEQLCQALKLKKTRCSINISGVGGEITGNVKYAVMLKFEVLYPERRSIEVNAYVVKRVTRNLPSISKNFRALTGFDQPLADSFIGKSAHVPVLLGANIASQIFLDGTRTFGGLLLQNTRLGWLVMGSGSSVPMNNVLSTHVSLVECQREIELDEKLEGFDKDLREFWDMPVIPEDIEEVETEVCEELFRAKYYQQEDGRYVVPIPWKQGAPLLGNSYKTAVSCFLAQERKMSKNPTHRKMSDEFMNEYISMGHMSLVTPQDHGVTNGDVYYIPYHSILKKDSVTTKLRNVFNASAKTSSGISLNDIIHPGPKLQTRIFDVITRTRQYRYIYSSDVTKMYRQILLLKEDSNRLRILYRQHRNTAIQEYTLNTVTYGIDCAPWQAIRTMQQVATDHSPSEEISSIIVNSFYMDDLYHGADSIEECQRQIWELTETLNMGKLPLTKWMSNSREVLQNVDECRKLNWFVDLNVVNSSTKALGIQYYPQEDMFGFKVKEFLNLKYSKRGMLSVTASLYDPLGLILPVIMKFRILLQKMWSLGIDWDDELDCKTKEEFQKFIACLPSLEKIRIPRWVGTSKSSELELIGFSDASGEGFAAVLYARVKDRDSFKVTLLAARGRVTPLKTKANLMSKLCTIPKMELEGLCLLCDLLKDVMKNLSTLNLNITAYTDSQVVLAWVRKSEEIDNKFVKRRVSKIRKVLCPSNVHYVKSAQNPADVASRGVSARDFVEKQDLWVHGPSWMKDENLPFTPFEKNVIVSNAAQVEEDSNEFITYTIERFSTFDKLIGCVHVILTWIQMFWRKIARPPTQTVQHIADAKKRVIVLQQQHSLKKEIDLIKKGKPLKRGHWLSFLCPYLDKDNILRVGERLDRAKIPRDQKHPILIPKSHLGRLIIRDIHWKNDHSPNALTDRILKETYWINGSRSIIRQEIHHCDVCLRLRAKTNDPQMSDLPEERISVSPIFESTCVDFAGPFTIRASKLKFEKRIKVWVSVFVCMSTKLSHLEICTELTAENFLSAFDRFTSRRSTPGKMLSDNGTNFVAANKYFEQQYQAMIKKSMSILATREIDWDFIPPGSPHFGGLHEACVRSFKFFLKRMARIESLTYEEFNTVVCKIESILNSRPLYPLSTDPNDELVLTPGHFAVQRCLKAPPSCPSSRKTIPITKKWGLVQQLQSDFWEIFTKEYLSTLQKRFKWIHPQPNLKIDDVVIVKDHITHTLDWPVGRIVKCYPDEKGTVRKVDVLCKNKIIVHRAVNKLVPLPTEEQENQLHQRKRETRRQSSRRPTSTLFSIALMFIFLMNCCFSLHAEEVLALSAGINVRRMGEVNVKTINVLFNLQTNVNVTADLEVIENQSEKFRRFCDSMVKVANSNNTKLCSERLNFLQREIKIAKTSILSSYGVSRERRFIAAISKLTIGGLAKKAAPYTLMAAAAGWQEYENWKTSQKLHAVEEKFNKVSFILLNISETETASLQHQLDNLVSQQQQLILEAETNSFASSIQSLISTVVTRHQSIGNIRPLNELEEYVKRLNSHSEIVRIPVIPNPEDLFTIHPMKKSTNDHLVVVQYDIPLSKPEEFVRYAVISAPNEDNEAVILDNDSIVLAIVFNKDNSSYFYPDESKEIFPNIYDEVKMQFHNSCTSSLIRFDSPNEDGSYHLCQADTWIDNRNMFPLGDETAVIIKAHQEVVTMNCGNQSKEILGKTNFVNYTGCYLEGVHSSTAISLDIGVAEQSGQYQTLEDHFSPLTIEQHTVRSVENVLNGLRSELKNAISDSSNITTNSDTLFVALIIFVIIVVLSSMYIICKRSTTSINQAREIALQSWTNNPASN